MKEKLSALARSVSFKQLRALSAVIEAGTINGDAQRLNVTAPAVGLQLRLLEAHAGMPLTERLADGLVATAAGRELLAAAARVELALADCAEALVAMNTLEQGKVAVGMISTAKYFTPFALAAFHRQHPRIDLRLSVGNRAVTIAALRDFALDSAIMGRPPDDLPVGPNRSAITRMSSSPRPAIAWWPHAGRWRRWLRRRSSFARTGRARGPSPCACSTMPASPPGSAWRSTATRRSSRR